ncbi:MAG: hypothetical protein KGL39_49795 [Patescibacteria group bacterium]|nr:hypothetical protein [Patescibacteria group bacterium]
MTGWIIRKIKDDVYEVFQGSDIRARIVNMTASMPAAAEHWAVSFAAGASAFNWDASSLDRAIGYVRGIERAAQVHAEETRPHLRRRAG